MVKRGKKPTSILSYVDELIETLRKSIPDAINTSDPKAVHQARVSTRRLKAAIDVFKAISSGGHRKNLSKVLRKLRKNLGALRDLQVMLEHLNELESARYKTGIAWMRDRLTANQCAAKENAGDEINVSKVLARLGAWASVRQEWAEAENELTLLIAESLHLQLDQFVELADRMSAHDSPEPLDPHQLRISGKALRYTLELAVAGGHKLPAGVMKSFKRMQDALGLWHDFVVLNDESLKSIIGHHHAESVLSVLDLAREMVRRSQRKLHSFEQLWNQRGHELSNSIRNAFPLTHAIDETPASAPQTDPDPSDSPAPPEEAPPVPDETSTA